MARARVNKDDEDVAVDRYGRPLPLVVMVDKAGNEVSIRDAAGLSSAHYGYGMDFAEEGLTYTDALCRILGDDADRYVVDAAAAGADDSDSSDTSKDISKSD